MNTERRRLIEGIVFLIAFGLTIPAANWLIGNAGTVCPPPHGPCLIPVAPKLMAPSGVLMIGIALVLDRKSTRLNSSHVKRSRMPSSA